MLYLIGVGIYSIGNLNLHTLCLFGVLQRIAICALVATLFYLWSNTRLRIAAIVILLVSYWILLCYIPVPGFGAGDLSIEGNLAHYIDRIVLGSHNYVGTHTWDPEGILSTLPAIATTLLGVLAGSLLQRTARTRLIPTLWSWGISLVIFGYICSLWMPINKKLWTDSFCLLMAGIDFLLLGGLIWLIDDRRWRAGLTLPLAFGQNALAIYILSAVSSAILWHYPYGHSWHDRIFAAVFSNIGSPKMSSLLFALTTLGILSMVAWVMQRRGWALKL